MVISCILGSLATCGLFFAGPGQYVLAAALFILGNIGFAAGNIFYNAYLTDLASGHEADQLSAKGFALGYIGGGLMLRSAGDYTAHIFRALPELVHVSDSRSTRAGGSAALTDRAAGRSGHRGRGADAAARDPAAAGERAGRRGGQR